MRQTSFMARHSFELQMLLAAALSLRRVGLTTEQT